MADRHRNRVECRALRLDHLPAGGFDKLLDRLILLRTLPGNALAVGRELLVLVNVIVCDMHQRPGHKRRIAMLAVDMRMHILRADAKALGERRLQPAGIENRAGADDLMLRKTGNLMEYVGQHVYGVGDKNINRLRRDAHNLRGNILEDVDVHLRQLESGLTRLPRKTGGDNHDIRVRCCLIVARADDGRRAEWRPLIDVQRLAERLLLVDVDQHDFRSGALNHQIVRNGCANAACTNHSNLTHNRTHPFLIVLFVPIYFYRFFHTDYNEN